MRSRRKAILSSELPVCGTVWECEMRLAAFTSPEVRALPMQNLVVVAPLGSFEQHGPHLPLTTDTDLVTAIAEAVERTMPEKLLLLPTLWIGHSTHHLHFPGTP